MENTKEIKIGTQGTRKYYTDEYPYEVTKVIDQKHVFIRELKAIRTDRHGMSDCQTYRYESNVNNPTFELVKRNGVWFKVESFNKETFAKAANDNLKNFKTFESAYDYAVAMAGLTQKQHERIEQGKDVKKYNKFFIEFGYAVKFYDYTY